MTNEIPLRQAVLLVGSYPALLSSRAALLPGCDTSAVSVEDAPGALRVRAYDLLLVCQTVQDHEAKELCALARSLHPAIKLLICPRFCGDPDLGMAAKYLDALPYPGLLQSVVSSFLAAVD